MNRFFLTFLMLLGMSIFLQAKGTLAGISISNQAQIIYIVGGIDNNLTSNTDEFVVDRIVDVHISWQDNSPVQVSAGDRDRILTFVVSNLGNSDDNISLVYDHNTSSEFDPTNMQIYLDTDGNDIFDPATDTVVTSLSNVPHDTNSTLFLVGDIPYSVTPSQKSYEGITAISDANATAGVDNPAAVDTVIRQKSDQDQGTYEVHDYWLESHKSAVVHSDDNATHTGTRITYTIDLSIGGNNAGKSITNVKLKDTIPSGTKYLPGSLHLDGSSLTDAADSDAGSCDGTTVQTNVGTISGANHRRVSFDVEVR